MGTVAGDWTDALEQSGKSPDYRYKRSQPRHLNGTQVANVLTTSRSRRESIEARSWSYETSQRQGHIEMLRATPQCECATFSFFAQ